MDDRGLIITGDDSWIGQASLMLASLIIIIHILLVGLYAYNVPLGDDYALLDFAYQFGQKALPTFDYLASLHNEHRPITERVLVLLDARIFGDLSFARLLYIANIYYVAIPLILFALHKSRILLLVSSLLFLIPNVSLNFFASSGLNHTGVLFFAIASIAFWHKKKNIQFLLFSIILAVLGTFTSASGIFIFIAIFVGVVMDRGQHFYRNLILTSIALVVTFIWYTSGYVKPGHHPSIVPSNINDLLNIFLYHSYFYVSFIKAVYDHNILLVLGFIVTLLFFIILYKNLTVLKNNGYLLLTTVFILLSGVVITLSRYGFSLAQAGSPRYKVHAALLIFVFIALILNQFKSKYVLFPILFILAINYTLKTEHSIDAIQEQYRKFNIAVRGYQEGMIDNFLLIESDYHKNLLSSTIQDGIYCLPHFKTYNTDVELNDILFLENDVTSAFEIVRDSEDLFEFYGYSIIKGNSSKNFEQFLILIGQDTTFYSLEPMMRPDITKYFNDGTNYTNSGYSFKILKDFLFLEQGIYNVGVVMLDKKGAGYVDLFNYEMRIGSEVKANSMVNICLDGVCDIKIRNDPKNINLSACSRSVTIGGWAINEKMDSAPFGVLITKDTSRLALIEMNVNRPDVAKVYNKPSFVKCGFYVDIDKDLLDSGLNKISITVVDEDLSTVGESRTFSIINK